MEVIPRVNVGKNNCYENPFHAPIFPEVLGFFRKCEFPNGTKVVLGGGAWKIKTLPVIA